MCIYIYIYGNMQHACRKCNLVIVYHIDLYIICKCICIYIYICISNHFLYIMQHILYIYIYIHMYIWWIHRRSDDWLDGEGLNILYINWD